MVCLPSCMMGWGGAIKTGRNIGNRVLLPLVPTEGRSMDGFVKPRTASCIEDRPGGGGDLRPLEAREGARQRNRNRPLATAECALPIRATAAADSAQSPMWSDSPSAKSDGSQNEGMPHFVKRIPTEICMNYAYVAICRLLLLSPDYFIRNFLPPVAAGCVRQSATAPCKPIAPCVAAAAAPSLPPCFCVRLGATRAAGLLPVAAAAAAARP